MGIAGWGCPEDFMAFSVVCPQISIPNFHLSPSLGALMWLLPPDFQGNIKIPAADVAGEIVGSGITESWNALGGKES